MIVLDTNVISEVMRPQPSEAVVAWLNRQPATNLFITSISLAESGSPMSFPDGQIAAITLTNRFMLATRNIKDFSQCGLDLVNPFEYFR